MGRKLAGQSVTGQQNQNGEAMWNIIKQQGTEIYLFLMLVIYPLFLVNGYGDLVYRKWDLLLYATGFFLLISVVGSLGNSISNRSIISENKKTVLNMTSLSVNDCFVIVYLMSVLISYAGAVDKQTGLWGIDTWYMGLVAQLLFIGMYFGISRGYTGSKYLKVVAALTGVIISSLVILQRFGINVFNLYDGYGDDVRLNFVTTLGQVTWSSSYISILLVAGMGIYYLTEGKKQKIFLGICLGIGFASELLLNCDSGVIAVFAAWMIMLWMAIGNRKRTLALLETVLIAVAATAVIGILERMFSVRMVPIDAVYLKVAQSRVVYVVLVVIMLIYLLLRSNKLPAETKKRTVYILKGIYLALVCLGIAGVIVLFILHEKNYFNGSPTENYFRFTIWWGNSRGFIWRTGAAVFADFDVWRKLFGCGPDCFTPYAYELMGDAINEFWHNQIVPNVHNEWFNALINYGIVGGVAYLGIFVSAACGFMKKAVKSATIEENAPMDSENRAVLFGVGLAAVGYIAHNILCYQQIIGTPLIFVLLGVGAAVNRKG